jgi:formylglycine-generating enzyme required for sulfatase activity
MVLSTFLTGCGGGSADTPSTGETSESGASESTDESAPTNETAELIMEPTETPVPVTPTPTSAPSDTEEGMIYIEGGEFIMGSDDDEPDETPQRNAYVDSFNIDKYPVTNAEYKEFVDDSGHPAPRNWKDGIPEGKENHPVTWVTWEDANAYAEWAGKRLPTEAEWERAARGVDGITWPWGSSFDADMCNSSESDLKETTPVDAYPDGASPDGAVDMAGNVWEWTDTWYDAYPASTHRSDRYGEKYKVIRGGSWFDNQSLVRCSARNKGEPTFMFSTIGFRCAK